jgi:ribosomal protein S21
MAVNIQITKTGNENSATMLRKFTQRVRQSGLINHVRDLRFRNRPKSKLMRKKAALRKLGRRDLFETLVKDGKISESTRGKRVRNWDK